MKQGSAKQKWLAYISKGKQSKLGAERSNDTQAVNESESNNN